MSQKKEVLPITEEEKSVVSRLSDLYVSHRGKYIICPLKRRIFTPKYKNGGYVYLHDSTLFGHIRQAFAVGVFATPSASKFLAFDIDYPDPEAVRKVVDGCVEFGIPREYVHLSTSGGKGYHAEVFFDSLVSTGVQRGFYNWVLDRMGLDPGKVEFRPTFTQAVKLPLSVHQKTGNMCWYVDDALSPIESIGYVHSIRKYPSAEFENLCALRDSAHAPSPKRKPREAAPVNPKPHKQEWDGCGELPRLTRKGQRNAMMVDIARTLITKRGYSRTQCKKMLVDWYRKQDPDLIGSPRGEVLRDIDNIVKWAKVRDVYPPVMKPEAIVGKDALANALAPRTKACRLILYYLTAGTLASSTGECWVTRERLAEAAGIAIPTVSECVGRLRKEGYIEVFVGRVLMNESGFHALPNRYAVHDPPPLEKKEAWKAPGDSVTIRMEDIEKDFRGGYYCTLREAFSEKWLKERLTKSEMEELKGCLK